MRANEILLNDFSEDIKKTRIVLERVPENKFDWRPHPKSWTMGELATHLANLLSWIKETCDSDSLDIAPPGIEQPKTEPVKTRTELLARFDEKSDEARGVLSNIEDDALFMDWTMLAGGKVVFTEPRLSVLRKFILDHSIHHRAQLCVYLRLNDIPVPAIYGPSADESGM